METRKSKTIHTVYYPEMEMDAEMSFQKITPFTGGIQQKPEVLFLMVDESQDETQEVESSISINEAKQMIEGLKAIVKEVEG